MIQPEGDRDFTGVFDAIADACDRLSVPLIVKETGAGISREVAIRLRRIGVAYVDVSGAGGTSWSRVEYARKGSTPGFEEWGIPTIDAIGQCRGILPLIASGGIRSGIDVAKAIAFGADIGGAAYPFIHAAQQKQLPFVLDQWHRQMKTAALLTGSREYAALRRAKVVIRH
jgi:isopentenyl-diphosphate Delta-isomerase